MCAHLIISMDDRVIPYSRINFGAFLVAQMVKNLSAMQEAWVRFLGREDPLEKGMATHSGIFVWRIHWTEKPGGLQSVGSQNSWTRLTQPSTHVSLKV